MRFIAPGTKYGSIEVLEGSYMHGKNRKYRARCCICNTVDYFFGNNLKKGNTTKCKGCRATQLSKERPDDFVNMVENGSLTHGLSDHYMYGAYSQMLRRCDWTPHIQYADYGGRGITVCQRWKDSFANFLEDMGERPEGMTLDRVNVNGNYEKSNCKWSSYLDQNRNKRNTPHLLIGDDIKSVHEWSELSGISVCNILKRIKRGWSNEDAVFKPIRLSTN